MVAMMSVFSSVFVPALSLTAVSASASASASASVLALVVVRMLLAVGEVLALITTLAV
jgi:hypothetical protein